MTLLELPALALLLLGVPIVLMYILKLRRQDRVVSSTLLWQRALDDVQANAPWQRLRPSVLLLLQLVALLALIFALLRPAYTSARTYSGDLIVVIDQSYGMQARDVAPSRFAVALARVRSLASQLGGGNVMSVIGMGPQPTLAIGESNDSGAIDRAVNNLQVGVDTPNVLAAVSEAASLARGGAQTRAIILTSRESGIESLPIQVPFPVQIVRIGANLHDLGITMFSAARSSGQVQALARISNFGKTAASSDVDLYVNNTLADVRPLSLSGGADTTLFWDRLPTNTGTLHLRIVRSDDMPIDKDAYAVVPSSETRRVLLVSPGDYFLQTVLRVDPSVQLSVVTPSQYVSSLAAGADIVVFDGALPSALPAVPTLIVSPPAGHTGPFRFGAPSDVGSVTAAPLSPSSDLASLLQYAQLSDVHVARARTLSAPAWVQPVLLGGNRVLLAAGDDGAVRRAFFTFNLQESDWPLRISFPVVLTNLLHYLSPGRAVEGQNLRVGQPIVLAVSGSARSAQITAPSGGTTTLRAPFPAYSDTGTPGIYTVRASGLPSVPVAVNGLPPRTAPAAGPSTEWIGAARPRTTQHVTVPIEIGWIFGVLALAVLTAEWWFAFRR